MTEDYENSLQLGLEYQDYVFDKLRKMDGMPIFPGAYSSRKYQTSKGESSSGLEIKYDRKFHKTGNLYIEIAEKSDANLARYTESGIMRDDNTWLYLIGDYKEAFIFAKNLLKALCNPSNKEIQYKETPTSQGYIFPLEYVKRKHLCAKHIIFENRTK